MGLEGINIGIVDQDFPEAKFTYQVKKMFQDYASTHRYSLPVRLQLGRALTDDDVEEIRERKRSKPLF